MHFLLLTLKNVIYSALYILKGKKELREIDFPVNSLTSVDQSQGSFGAL